MARSWREKKTRWDDEELSVVDKDSWRKARREAKREKEDDNERPQKPQKPQRRVA